MPFSSSDVYVCSCACFYVHTFDGGVGVDTHVCGCMHTAANESVYWYVCVHVCVRACVCVYWLCPDIIARNKEMIRLMTRGGVWRGNSSVPRTEIDRYRRLKTLRDTYKGFPHPPASAPSTHRIRPAGPPKQERAGTSGSKGDAGNPPHSSSSQPPPPPPPPPPRAPYGGRETGSPRRGRGNSPRGKGTTGMLVIFFSSRVL